MPPITPQKPHRAPPVGRAWSSVTVPETPTENVVPVLRPSESPETTETESQQEERKQTTLLREARPTHAAVWCGAILCVAFSVALIAAGVLTLVVFLVIKPRNPIFDTAGATLNNVYLDSPAYYNGDLTFLANFSNPNHKIDVRFEYVSVELFFRDTLVAAQGLPVPFALRRGGEARLVSVHMVSSEVYLTPELLREVQVEMGGGRVGYSIRGTFKVRGSLGLVHFTYWLYGRCSVELGRPPSGVLVARTCRTRR